MTKTNVPLDKIRFAVVDRPACVWGVNLDQENLRFLRGLQPDFFLYQAAAHENPKAAGAGGYAALALRLNYGMAVEALFGILGAIVQAPDCVYGWLSLYSNAELRELVRRLQAKEPLRTLLPFSPPSLETISAVLLGPLEAKDPEQHKLLRNKFARAWALFADELLSEQSTREYNSLKHSFRVQPGAFTVNLAHEGTTLLRSESELGHSFPFVKRMKDRKNQYDVKHSIHALSPAFYVAALKIIALSIGNAIAFARDRLGDTRTSICVPNDSQLFEELWKEHAPITALGYGGSVTAAESEYWSDAEILSVYEDDAPNEA